jgi:chromosome segregation ATPase
MDATAELTRALVEWRRLTELEGEAILGDDWHGVTEQQARKARLQAEIQSALASIRATSSDQAHTSRETKAQFDSVADELMALERRNGDLLAAKRNRRRPEAERLAQTLHDLQGVRRAYGSSRGPHWQSYS